MAQNQKSYDNEFKAQAVKLAQEIGGHKAAKELGIPDGTIYCWSKAFKEGRLSANEAVHSPMDLCQYFGHKKLKGYADFFNSSSSFCCGVI